MNNRKTWQYLANGVKAEVTHLWGKTDKHYIRLRLWCKQMHELVTVEFAMGTADELRQQYCDWQEHAFNYAAKFGKVRLCKIG